MKTFLYFPLLFVCLVLLFISTTLNAQDSWKQLPGPFGGDILAIDTEGTNLVVGTAGGGVFFSSDNGNKWTSISNGLSILRVDFVLIHNSNIFAAKKGENIFVSDDFGKSWKVADNGLPNHSLTSIVKLKNKIYCSVFGSGIFMSDDNGTSWTAKNKGLSSYNVNSLTVYRNAIYAATQTGAYLSGNYGDSWGQIRNSNFNVKLIALNGKDIFLTTNIVVMYSSNNGLDWYAANYQAVGSSIIHSIISTGPYVIIGRDSGLYVATYAWNTWTNINTSLYKNIVKNLLLSGNNLYACTKYGLYLSNDFGGNWVDDDDGIINQKITKVLASGDTIYAGTERNGIFLSADKGQTWKDMGLGKVKIIDLLLKSQELFVLSSKGIFASSTNGVVWEFRDDGLENLSCYNIVARGNDLIVGTDKGLYRSTNDGWRWDKVSSTMEEHQIRSIFIDRNQDIYAATEENIYYSTNNGDSWNITNYGMDNLSTTCISGNDDIMVVGTYPEKYFSAVIYISYDGSKTWQSSNIRWKNQYISSIVVSGINIFATLKSSINGEDLGVLFSSNNGKSWHTFNKGLSILDVNSLTVHNNKIYASTDGAGIFSADVPPLFPAVNLITPKNKAKNLIVNPLFDWEDAQDFDFYTLQIANMPEKIDKHLILDTSLKVSEYLISDSLLQNNTTYYWRVRVTKGTRESDWSDVFTFSTENNIITKTKLLTPEDSSTNVSTLTHFTWDKLSDATDYYLQVSTSKSFTDNAIDIIVPNTYYDAPKTKLDFITKYYWRVKAKIHSYVRDWSEISSFTTEKLILTPPQLISPKNNADSLTLNVTLNWAIVPNADKYRLQLSSDENFSDVLIDYIVSDSSYKIPENILKYKSNYYWKVKALLNDKESKFSEVWKFSTMLEVGVNGKFISLNSVSLAPNPVSDVAMINLAINSSNNISINLYNSLGMKVREIFNNRLDYGVYNFEMNAVDLINGIYFIQVRIGNDYKVLKLILKH